VLRGDYLPDELKPVRPIGGFKAAQSGRRG
jgi:hypothetical protein